VRTQQKITPCLWFDDQAEEAVAFYVSVFPHARILEVTHFGEAGPRPAGMVLTVSFGLEGQEYMALNGGPQYSFTPAISLVVSCESQEEVDDLWAKLTAGGQEVQCGWLTDRFGLSWQIVPRVLDEMLADEDTQKAQRVMAAMLQMIKIDIAALRRAYDGAE
jgi:predicted 3-demethylubiquinone-9 3-methyltransferase (glyoxalase superfamily)